MNSADRAALEHFVRADLGCNCPDEVFESMTIEHDAIPGLRVPCARLVVGNRLLVYVLEATAGSPAAEALSSLANLGPAERDARGLNRFRLVVGAECPGELRAPAGEAFARIAGHDERAHLHVVPIDRLPDALRDT